MKKFAKQAKALMIIALMSVTLPALAQNSGEIKGKVLEDISKEPVFGASVWVEVNGTIHGVTSDMDGKFTIKPLNPGLYTVYVTYVGKSKLGQQVEVNPGQITYSPDLILQDSTFKEMVVQGYTEPLINPEETSVITVRYKQIAKNPNLRNIKQLTSSLTSDFQMVNGQAYVRGGRADATIYFVDGVKCRDGNINIPGVAIGSLTVYTGGVPAKYGDVTSGVVIIETKSYFDLYNDWLGQQALK